MKKIVEFFVPGKRIATAGSKTAFRTTNGKMVYRHASKFTKPWMDTVRYFAGQAYSGEILQGPLGLIIWFQLSRPKGHFGTGRNEGVLKGSAPPFPATQPDLSKAVRAIEDALTGLIWKDDSQVVYLQTAKIYEPKTGAHIVIMEIDNYEELSSQKS